MQNSNKAEMDNLSVKDNIIRIRKSRNLSQTEMAERLGISRTAYRNIENGETRLISDNLIRIAEICGTGVENLILGYHLPEHDETIADSREETYRSAVEDLKAKFADEVSRLTGEIERLNNEISTLKNYIGTQQELIRTKDEIISMLKKVDSENRNR